MAWVGLPLVSYSTDISAWSWIIQFWEATRERWLGLGHFWWPAASTPFGQGVVPSGITATTFTDTHANNDLGWGTAHQNPWSAVVDDYRLDGNPGWYLVIDDCDYRKVIKTHVTGNTATVLTYSTIIDYITAGYIPSLASLVGKSYYFIRSDYGLTWAERQLEFPNDYEHAAGTVNQYHDPLAPATVTNPTHSTLKDRSIKWAVDEHAGRDLLVYAEEDNLLKRVTITGNSRYELTFATQSWTPKVGAAYIVVAAGGKGYPGKSQVRPFSHYRGGKETVEGHYPLPTAGLYPHATTNPTLDFFHGDLATPGPGCEPQANFLAIDNDYISDFAPTEEQMGCGFPAEKFFAPDFHKTLRALQINVELMCPNFVEKKDYESESAMPLLVPALLFELASIGLSSRTSLAALNMVDGGVDLTDGQTWPYYPISIHWAVLDDLGELVKSGTGSMDTSTHLDWGTTTIEAGDIGKTVVLSTGWPRHLPREVQRMFYPRTAFIPDIVTDEFGSSAIDPPSVQDFAETGCAGTGRWEFRDVSSKYYEQGIFGPEESDTFVVGELARYSGDNWNDKIEASDSALVSYIDHFYTGRFSSPHQNARRSQRKGQPTSATSTSLTDSTKNWLDEIWYEPVGTHIAHTESGTATGGSTTTLVDSSKLPGTPETAASCWWKATRFTNFSGPYVGFILEILLDGPNFEDPSAVVEKRFITAGNAATATLTFDVPLASSPSGKQYRIREPAYNLNRWAKHRVRFTYTDGTSGTAIIRGNDDTTIFFTLGLEKEIDLTKHYRIIEHETGGVWKWDGTSWTRPTGADVVRKFAPVPSNFVYWQPGDLPTYFTRYGRMVQRDDVSTVVHALYKAFNALVWVRSDVSWENPEEDANDRHASTGDDDAFETWDNLWTTGYTTGFEHFNSVLENWNLNAGSFVAGGTPYSLAVGANQFCLAKSGDWGRRAAKAKLVSQQVSCPVASQTAYWVFTTITEADPDNDSFTCTEIESVAVEPGHPDRTYYTYEYRRYKFNAGADGTHYRAFHKWDEEAAPTTDLERFSDFLADIATSPGVPIDPHPAALTDGCHINQGTATEANQGVNCATPAASEKDWFSQTTEGWYAKRVYAVRKFDVAGGFSKWE